MFKKKIKIFVFVDTDIAVRHFIKSGAFFHINQNHDVTYIFNKDDTSEKPATYTDPSSLGLKKVKITKIPRKRTGKWFPLYMASVIKQQKGLPNYKPRVKDAVNQNGISFVIKSYLRSLPIIYSIFRTITIKKLGIDKSLLNLIKLEKPDVIIHPSILQGYYINELIQVKDKLGIPVILLMNSWDNPSAKAVSTGLPSKIVVWGEQSRQHSIEYLKFPKKIINIFGAAQFEIYKYPPNLSKSTLCNFFDVPKNKRIIVYAGSGAGSHETKYLKALDESINKKILKNTHIIYRPHPWRGGLGKEEKNFFELNLKNITMDPHMVEYYKNQIINPDRKVFMIDYKISNMLLNLTDALISPLSTMLIESMILGKPILIFFPKEDNKNGLSVDEVHFSELIRTKDVITVFKFEELMEGLLKLNTIIGDKVISKRLKKSSQFFHYSDQKTYSEKLNDLAINVYKSVF